MFLILLSIERLIKQLFSRLPQIENDVSDSNSSLVFLTKLNKTVVKTVPKESIVYFL